MRARICGEVNQFFLWTTVYILLKTLLSHGNKMKQNDSEDTGVVVNIPKFQPFQLQ